MGDEPAYFTRAVCNAKIRVTRSQQKKNKKKTYYNSTTGSFLRHSQPNVTPIIDN